MGSRGVPGGVEPVRRSVLISLVAAALLVASIPAFAAPCAGLDALALAECQHREQAAARAAPRPPRPAPAPGPPAPRPVLHLRSVGAGAGEPPVGGGVPVKPRTEKEGRAL